MFLVFFRPNDNIKLNYHFEICHNRVNWNYHMELLNNRLMFILCVFTDSIYRSINNILFQHVISIPIYNLEIKSILELLTQCKIYCSLMFTKFKNLNDCKLRSCMCCSFILNAFLIICTSGKIAVFGG